MEERRMEALLIEAEKAMERAVAPFSSLRVGSAILASDGRIFTGCNIENPSLMLTICAERVALYKALSEGVRDFRAIAVVSSSGEATPPCGVCRQILYEFSPSLVVILKGSEGVKTLSLEELLPLPFKYERR